MKRWLMILAMGVALSACAEDRPMDSPAPEERLDEDSVDAGSVDLPTNGADSGGAQISLTNASITLEVENENWPSSPIRISQDSYEIRITQDSESILVQVENEESAEEFESFQLTIGDEIVRRDIRDLEQQPILTGRQSGTLEPLDGFVEIDVARGTENRLVAGLFELQMPIGDSDDSPTFEVVGTFEISFERTTPGD